MAAEDSSPRQKPRGFTMAYKGLVLISIPVAALLIFVGLVKLHET